MVLLGHSKMMIERNRGVCQKWMGDLEPLAHKMGAHLVRPISRSSLRGPALRSAVHSPCGALMYSAILIFTVLIQLAIISATVIIGVILIIDYAFLAVTVISESATTGF